VTTMTRVRTAGENTGWRPVYDALRYVVAASVGLALCPSGAAAHEGWGVVVDSRGRVYCADIPANTIWRISSERGMEAVGRHIHSHALSIGTDDAVYGMHVSLTAPVRGVWRLDSSGRFADIIVPTSGLALGLQSFLRAPDGVVYSASAYQYPAPPDGRTLYLLRWSPGGRIDTVAGGAVGHADGDGRTARFESIDGMALLPDGSVVIADGARLRRVSATGQVTSLGNALTSKRWDQDLLGVAAAPDGRLYVADFAARVVLRVEGVRVDALYSPSAYWAPSGVAVTPSGVYVLEHPRAPLGILGDLKVGPYLRVRRFSPNGQVTTLATRWGDSSRIVMLALGACAALAVWVLRRRGTRQAGAARGGLQVARPAVS